MSPSQDDVIVLMIYSPRAETMDETVMIRADYAQILRTVILHLGDGLNVMNLNDGKCSSCITPLICDGSSGLAVFYLALRSHQSNDQLSEAARTKQPLICFSSPNSISKCVNSLENTMQVPSSQIPESRTLFADAVSSSYLT